MTEYAPEIIRAIDYARRVVNGDELAGHFVRSAASRFLDDLDAAVIGNDHRVGMWCPATGLRSHGQITGHWLQ